MFLNPLFVVFAKSGAGYRVPVTFAGEQHIIRANYCRAFVDFIQIVGAVWLFNALDILIEVSKHLIEMLKEINPTILYDLRKYYPELTKELIVNRKDHVYNNIKTNLLKGIEQGIYRNDLNPDIITSIYVKRMDDVIFEDDNYLNRFQQHEIFSQLFIYHIRGIVSTKGLEYFENKIKNEPEEHEDKEIHSEEDIVYHDKYPFNKYEMEKELYSECMDVLHKLEFTITLLKRENLTEIHRKILPSFLLFKKQQIFHLPSPLDARNYLAFIAAEGNVLLVNIPVSGFQFLYQLAFGKVFAT